MPTKTFLNLPSEKQETLLKAAREEFQRVPLQDASINRIIQEAKIPRGSFYMYFKDKEDLYLYTVGNLIDFLFEKTYRHLKEEKGDILEAYLKFYDELVDFCVKEEHRKFFENLVMSLTPDSKHAFLKKENEMSDRIEKTLDLIDLEKFSIDREYAADLIDILSALMMRNMMKVFRQNITIEESRERVAFLIRSLGYGLYNRKENKEC